MKKALAVTTLSLLSSSVLATTIDVSSNGSYSGSLASGTVDSFNFTTTNNQYFIFKWPKRHHLFYCERRLLSKLDKHCS